MRLRSKENIGKYAFCLHVAGDEKFDTVGTTWVLGSAA